MSTRNRSYLQAMTPLLNKIKITCSGRLALFFLTAVLSSCASLPEAGSSPVDDRGELNLQTIRDLLPGAYSNFAQNHDQDSPVTDINIRQLKTGGEPVFLFASELRGPGSTSHDIYWLKLNARSNQAELHFTRLREDELSLPMQEVLSIAWQRVVPGCVIRMSSAGDQINGQTDPRTCRFGHPLQGETSLMRRLSIGGDTLSIKTELQDKVGVPSPDDAYLELQKHRDFQGWAGIREEAVQLQGEPGKWQLSQVFNTRDDGRVSYLYDQQMQPMGFGLQLARLPRFDGEPPYYLLSVVNLKSGQIQAYQWLPPATERLDLNLDWFQTSLELMVPENPQP